MSTKTKDHEHLGLLSIFYYVLAGITFLTACFPIIHLVAGIGLISGWGAEPGAEEETVMVGWLFASFAGTMILLGWILAFFFFRAGQFLSRRKKHTFCMVMAALACLFVPHGTVLGVLTILVLQRDSVKEMFGVQAPAPPVAD
ncbi:MAG: hypothetical protein HKN21_16280 [Candidatus Eisenbacteria bacterium]|uniref:Uncharacterized protein n=1 Tax=Eiseniibacteriota bacterium TaxID=2212470 RepID=A0A7Y2EAN6_UNCEI|nr:hypothetical protein [Candidatus Eisenbacteria bacterium]